MELKDYLHLYLGCKVETEGANIRVLDLVLLHLVLIDKMFLSPILRPLSDIKKEEKSIYNKMFKSNIPLPIVEANRTRFLLSKHFDLFGLIEAGLAIDKTTLKQRA